MRYEVTIEVDSVSGECSAGHKVGDRWVTKSPEQPLAICPVALVSIWQKVYAMLLGADFWWSDEPDVAYFVCPDYGKVRFKISRRPRET
ncbi:MAG: TIGR04076 family protein [Planctomycetota bacterium]|nr:TIGR04076 family protein [Planctomycetota bacterium]